MSRLSLPTPEWDRFVAEADAAPEAYFAELTALRDEIMREQASGAWDPQSHESAAEADTRVSSRIRRGIEVVALLRRTNTGPAKPKGAGGKGRRKKTPVDLEAINASLLE